SINDHSNDEYEEKSANTFSNVLFHETIFFGQGHLRITPCMPIPSYLNPNGLKKLSIHLTGKTMSCLKRLHYGCN
ncbi:MAG TPA: hypothetical protein VFV08_10220, partial [Puia sp.]|nr:hypothetical protein [Puia sp.]